MGEMMKCFLILSLLVISLYVIENVIHEEPEPPAPLFRCATYSFHVQSNEESLDALKLMYQLAIEMDKSFSHESFAGYRATIGDKPIRVVLVQDLFKSLEFKLIHLAGGVAEVKGRNTAWCSSNKLFKDIEKVFRQRWELKQA